MGSSKKYLWHKARRGVEFSVIALIIDHLRGRQGIIARGFNGAFLQIDFLRFRLRREVHRFSFVYSSPVGRVGGLKNTAFIPKGTNAD